MSVEDFISLPEYENGEIPDKKIKEWKYPRMSKIGMRGETRYWQGGILEGGIVTYFGQQDGKMQLTEPYEIETNTSGRNFNEQAALQLQSKYEIKYRKEGYRFEGDKEIQEKGPMLANDWRKRTKSTILYFPVAVQPKLDGIRCLVNYDRMTGKLKYRSRTHKNYDFGYLFDEEIEAMMPFFPSEVQLDGELYIHGKLLQEISSIVSLKTTEEDLKKLKGKKLEKEKETLRLRREELKYNIFTIITGEDMVYEDRRRLLVRAAKKAEKYLGRKLQRVQIVPDHFADSMEEVEEILDLYVGKGYEGVMIYKVGESLPASKVKESYYKSGRSWNLIKYKPFFDEEMEIIEVKSGKGKAAELAGTRVVDSEGIIHEVNIASNDAIRKKILENPDSIIGKMATVKHYGKTDAGKLRHASVICIRDYE